MISARTADGCELGPRDWKRSARRDGKHQPAEVGPLRARPVFPYPGICGGGLPPRLARVGRRTVAIRLCADVSRVRPVSTPLPTTSLAGRKQPVLLERGIVPAVLERLSDIDRPDDL